MRYEGIIDEILYYGERSKDGRWIIPITVDWDYTLTKCSSWDEGTMEIDYDAFKIMKRWIEDYNVGFILDTMRHDEIIEEPLKILKENGIELYGIRRNPQQDKDGNTVTKAWAVMSIDDRNLGVPLKMHEGCDRPHVDWERVDKMASPILDYISKQLEKVRL